MDVVPSTKFHNDGCEFDHLVAYSMTCTTKNDSECAMKHGVHALNHVMK